MTKYLYILPLLAALTFSLTAQAEKPMTKEEFYAKHNIVGDSLIPPSFDMEALKKALVEHRYNEERVNRILGYIKKDMTPPKIFEGFYGPGHTIWACNTNDVDCLKKIGLTDDDIESEFPQLDEDEAKKRREENLKHHSAEELDAWRPVLGRAGDNIYIHGIYGGCGTGGCGSLIGVRENGKWNWIGSKEDFTLCYLNENIEEPNCFSLGSVNLIWNFEINYYPPLGELYDRHCDVYLDYVHQFIQKPDDEND